MAVVSSHDHTIRLLVIIVVLNRGGRKLATLVNIHLLFLLMVFRTHRIEVFDIKLIF